MCQVQMSLENYVYAVYGAETEKNHIKQKSRIKILGKIPTGELLFVLGFKRKTDGKHSWERVCIQYLQ